MAAPERAYRAVDVYRGNCSKRTFYSWVAQGRVTLHRVGGTSYCFESFAEIVRRIAAEDQASEASHGQIGRQKIAANRAARRAVADAAAGDR